jgi:hypothetical protein
MAYYSADMMYSRHSSLAQLFGDDSDGFRSGLDDDGLFGHGNLWWSKGGGVGSQVGRG